MRLFVDANVVFTAASSSDGPAAALFPFPRRGRCTLVASPRPIEEARRNFALKAAGSMPRYQVLSGPVRVVPEADPRLGAWAADLGPPPNDAPALAGAVTCGADLLATSDRRHFGHLYDTPVCGVTVVTPAGALARIMG